MRRHRLVSILVALLAVLVGAGLWALIAPEPPFRRLPDGSTARLESVGYGTSHDVVLGKRWLKLLHPVVSPSLRERLGVYTQEYRTRQDTLVFWLLRRNKPQGPQVHERVTVVDEHGCESETAAGTLTTFPNNKLSDLHLDAYAASVFPRRGRTVALRLYERKGEGPWKRMAEFVAGNPTAGPHSVWTPDPLPVKKQQGDLQFTLTQLRTGVSIHQPSRAASDYEEKHTLARFRVTRNGKPSREWEPIEVHLSDATGNNWDALTFSPSQRRDEQEVLFHGGLWADEAAWKLGVEFQRNSGFRPEELWTVRNIRVPPGPQRNTFTQAAVRRHNATIRLRRVAGPYAGDPSDFTGFSYETYGAYVRVEPPTEGIRVSLVRATDEQGRIFQPFVPGWDREGRFGFGLEGLKGSKTVDLTFAIHKSRFVEFLAKPERPAS
jgi:hypothetical protein